MECPSCKSKFFDQSKLYCKVCNYYLVDEKKHSDYFVHFVINKHKFDFNEFRSREEFLSYMEELKEFGNE